jgi:hypothetical protein
MLSKQAIATTIYNPMPLPKQNGYEAFPTVLMGTPNAEKL